MPFYEEAGLLDISSIQWASYSRQTLANAAIEYIRRDPWHPEQYKALKALYDELVSMEDGGDAAKKITYINYGSNIIALIGDACLLASTRGVAFEIHEDAQDGRVAWTTWNANGEDLVCFNAKNHWWTASTSKAKARVLLETLMHEAIHVYFHRCAIPAQNTDFSHHDGPFCIIAHVIGHHATKMLARPAEDGILVQKVDLHIDWALHHEQEVHGRIALNLDELKECFGQDGGHQAMSRYYWTGNFLEEMDPELAAAGMKARMADRGVKLMVTRMASRAGTAQSLATSLPPFSGIASFIMIASGKFGG